MKPLKNISDLRLSYLLAFLALFGVLLVFLPVVLFSIYQVVKNSEMRYTQMEVHRSANILHHEMDQLDPLIHSISSWDDTYQFVLDKNQRYIDNNLSDSTFASGNINFFIALNTSNEVVFAKFFDRQTQTETAFPFEIASFLQSYPVLLMSPDFHTGRYGLVMLTDQPVLVAARSILTSLEVGPAHGTLIFGQFLGSKELEAISELTQCKVSILGARTGSTETPGCPPLPS
jgi:sensor domain CHASE-containing protein